MVPIRLRCTPLTVVALAAIGALCAPIAPRPAAAQDSGPIYLKGNPDLHADRVALLREEFRERQKEIREQIERAKHARLTKKQVHGRKAIPVAPDEDRAAQGAQAAHGVPSFSTLTAPTNVKANNKTGDAAGAGQAEQSPAFLGLNGLCAWNDGQGFNLSPQDVQGYGYSTDGGASWTDGGIPMKGGTIATWSSDPSVTVNEKTGDFYYTGLTTNTGTQNGVGVARGHFSGASFIWDNVSVVAQGPNASQVYDKEWMCADSTNGNLYVTWTLFDAFGDYIYFSRSTNNGASWSVPMQISGSWENGLVSGSRPMVGPNGEVYVQYTAIGQVDADSVKIAKSTNGGVSFGPSVVAMTPYDNFFDGAPGFNRPRAVTFASGAVDRSFGSYRGRVYMTIQDCVDFYNDPLFINSGIAEVENNGNPSNATAFTIGQTLRGSLTGSTDQDWYKFPATQGTTYIFYVDSLRTSSLRYTMRLYCPKDTVLLSRLAFSGAQATNSALGSHSLIVWTAPTTDTYYLRMVVVTVGSGANPYRILTGTHTVFGSDVARDTRDVMVTSSPDGVTGWAPRLRVNDDAPLYDNWLPEVAVPCDGHPYVMWFDWRDTPASCFGGSNIYLSRSSDGGATWSANQVVTTAVTANWTQVASNIAPNQGDYNGMYGGDNLAMAWADGRLGDADVFAARLVTEEVLACPGDGKVTAGTTYTNNVGLTNQNSMFDNSYGYTVSVDRSWSGLPFSNSTTVAASSSGLIPLSIAVPDSAADGEVVNVCVIVSQAGACPDTCCFKLHINNLVTAALGSLVQATAVPGHVSLQWFVQGNSMVNVYRTEKGTGWSLLGQFRANPQGYLNVEDLAVKAGAQYGYHIGILSGGREQIVGETWVTVPVSAQFALGHVYPNPSPAGFSVDFSLMGSSPATLELIDVSGRRVLSREVGAMGAGSHKLLLEPESGRFPAGVYSVRLSQSGRVATNRVSVIR